MPYFGQPYDRIEDAAAAAAMLLQRQPRAEEIEYIALLLQNPETGKFFRSDFQTQYERNSANYSGGIPSGSLRGMIHNHPVPSRGAAHSHTKFTPTDVTNTAGRDLAGFLVPMEGPGKGGLLQLGKESRKMGRHRGGPVEGEKVLAQIPIEELLQFHARRNPLMAAYLAQRDTPQMASTGGR